MHNPERPVKRLPWILLTGFFLLYVSWCFCQKPQKRMQHSIVFYNVENLFDTVDDTATLDEEFLPGGTRAWTRKKYKIKLNNLYKTIVAIDAWDAPDVIGLCEVENKRVLNDLISGTPLVKDAYSIIHFDSRDARGIDVALLYRPASFKLLNSGNIRPVFEARKDYFTRDILYVKGTLSGDTLHIFINHWPSRRNGIIRTSGLRETVAGYLRRAVDSIMESTPEPYILIMGDFNDEADNPSLAKGLGAGLTGQEIQERALYCVPYSDNPFPGTYKYQGRWYSFDRFIVSGNLLSTESSLFLDPPGTEVFNRDFMIMEDERYLGVKPFPGYYGFQYLGGFSDHLPIRIVIRTRK